MIKYVKFTLVEDWCACTHVSGITNWGVVRGDFPTIQEIVRESFEDLEPPCLMVTVNEEEEAVISWLKANKFKKGPWLRNWGHGGRKTQAWFYQIKVADWKKYSGRTQLGW
jgi:hypothetical protein